MNPKIKDLIATLHESPTKVCLVTTGAAAGCQQLLSSVPGASRTLLDSAMPYDRRALSLFMGRPETDYPVNGDTALDMAAKAWRRAREVALRNGESPEHALGVAVTGVIDAGRPQRGELRLHMAVRGPADFLVADVSFKKDAENRSVLGREVEGRLSDQMALNLILYAASLEQMPFLTLNVSGDLAGAGESLSVLSPRRVLPTVEHAELNPERHVLFDGSFDPWHHGHENIAKEVETMTGRQVVYVIADSHPDKPVPPEQLAARLGQFCRLAPVFVAKGLRLYVEKAEAQPGFWRIIGADTLRRLLDPKYGVPTEEVLRRLWASRAHFFVADRPHGDDPATFGEVSRQIPWHYNDMFTPLGTVIDASSTAARKASQKSS